MKLAEALILRADQQKRLEQLRQRIVANARVQEGDAPAEDPRTLLAELDQVAGELESLIRRINRTNTLTSLADGLTLTDSLARRDVLRWTHTAYRKIAEAAGTTPDRYSRSEIKYRSTIDIAATQRHADDLARSYRELDTRIQEANWQTELLD
jgi:hypothetical protein